MYIEGDERGALLGLVSGVVANLQLMYSALGVCMYCGICFTSIDGAAQVGVSSGFGGGPGITKPPWSLVMRQRAYLSASWNAEF